MLYTIIPICYRIIAPFAVICVVTAFFRLSQLNISDEILKKELCRLEPVANTVNITHKNPS